MRKLTVQDREDYSAAVVVDENDETVLVDVTCNFPLLEELVSAFNSSQSSAMEVHDEEE